MIHILIKAGKPMTRKEMEEQFGNNRTTLLALIRTLIKHKEVKRIFDENNIGILVPKYQLIEEKKKKRKRKKTIDF